MRIVRCENRGWRFELGAPEEAAMPGYNDASWRAVDLPHDFMIEQPFNPNAATGRGGGFLPGGVGWYRKHMDVPADWAGRRVHIDFDGVMANGRVFVNGAEVNYRPNGYVGIRLDITDALNVGGENVIAVRADTAEQPASRWYAGGGIYRDVRLVVTHPLHFAKSGILVRTQSLDDAAARVEVTAEMENLYPDDRQATLRTTVRDGEQVVAETSSPVTLASRQVTEQRQTLRIKRPKRWSTDRPHLYEVSCTILEGEHEADEDGVTLGLRTIEFDADRGFLLNGIPTKLKGVNNHDDQGPLGVKCFRDGLIRRLDLLRRMGCNAIRCAHNPYSPHFYDLCDRMGFLVIDEIFDEWKKPKREYSYHRFFDEWWLRDLTDQLRANRNHTSIIAWSVGNEIPEKGSPEGVETLRMLRAACHDLDPTRPVTAGCNGIHGANRSGFANELDVVGINGGEDGCFNYDENHEKYPGRKLYASEVPHTFATRGIYQTLTRYRDKTINPDKFARERQREVPDLTKTEVFEGVPDHYYSSYDNALVRINVRDSWRLIAERGFMAGEFRWTGFDYLGESHGWPAKSSNAGVIDLCGFPKDPYYLYQSLWSDRPMVHLLPHWTHPGKEGVVIPVWAYTNCDEAELFLDGESLGRQRKGDAYHLSWEVPYRPGELHVKAYSKGKPAAEQTVNTAGEPSRVVLEPDRTQVAADRMSLVHVTARIADEAGNFCPSANNPLQFRVEGPAEVIGVGNGDPASDESAVAAARRAFMGQALCILRPTGDKGVIHLSANGKPLERDSVRVTAR